MLYYHISEKKIIYFAHRGAPKLKHENTIESINKAISIGCDAVEVDIQLSQDNQIILFHDDHIKHAGEKHNINKTNLNKINGLCISQKIPKPARLDQLIQVIKNNPQIIFNIEIKSLKKINYKLLKIIKNQIPEPILSQQCIISSINYLLILEMKLIFSKNISKGYILGRKRFGGTFKMYINKLLILFLKPQFLHLNGEHATKDLVDWSHRHSMYVNIYTINKENKLEKMINLGADGIFTDNHNFYKNQ